MMSYINRNPFFISPTSLTAQVGGTPIGSVSDIQTFLDGNVYNLPEAAGTPGFELDIDFTNIAAIYSIFSMIRYNGSTMHQVSFRIHNFNSGNDDEFHVINSTGTIFQCRTIYIPIDADYIDGSNNAQVIIHHNSAGNAAHDLFVDYVAILGREL